MVNYWAVITGAGSGIGASLAHCLSKKGLRVLAIGRRAHKLEEMLKACPEEHSQNIRILSADIASKEGRETILKSIPYEQQEEEGAAKTKNYVLFLIQNAAIGDPGRLLDIDGDHFQYAMNVNVTAPLMLAQQFITHMQQTKDHLQGTVSHEFSCGPRILHLGTSVAFRPQLGTATYGVTKMAFHRLYLQLKEELASDFKGVSIGSASPGVVDTEGVRTHVQLATQHNLPHVAFFDQVKRDNAMIGADISAEQLANLLLNTSCQEFSAKEWSQTEMAEL